MEQVTKLKRAWNLAPIFQIVQKISEKYCPSWYLSADQVWWVNELCFKIYRIVAEETFNVPRNIRESFPWTNKSATKKHLRLQFWINLHSIFYKTPELDSEINEWSTVAFPKRNYIFIFHVLLLISNNILRPKLLKTLFVWIYYDSKLLEIINPLSANPTKCSTKLNQFVGYWPFFGVGA